MAKYSSHARKRMLERFINESDVESALARPLEVVQTRYGRKAACKRQPGGKYLVVVFEEAGEDFIVVTAVKVDRNRVGRYGFARV
jgi:hypothetical protein